MDKAERDQKLTEALKQFDVLAVERLLAERSFFDKMLHARGIVLRQESTVEDAEARYEQYLRQQKPEAEKPEARYEQYLLIRSRNRFSATSRPFLLAFVVKSSDVTGIEPVLIELVADSKNITRLRVLWAGNKKDRITWMEVLETNHSFKYNGIYRSDKTSAYYKCREYFIFGGGRGAKNRKRMEVTPLDGAPKLTEGEILIRTEMLDD